MIAPGDTRTLITALEKQGWKVTKTSNGHYRAVPPDPTRQIVVFSSGKDMRGWRNALEDLRRSGFEQVQARQIDNGNREREWDQCPICKEWMFSTTEGRCYSGKGACSPNAVRESPIPVIKKSVQQNDLNDLNDLFQKLRDAKELHALAIAESDRAKAELLKLKERVEGCLRAESDTAKDLLEAKRAFDAAFGIRPPE